LNGIAETMGKKTISTRKRERERERERETKLIV